MQDGGSTRITIISTLFFPPSSVVGGSYFFGTMKVSDVRPTSLRRLHACALLGPYLSASTHTTVFTAVRGAKGKDRDVTSHSSMGA